MKIRFSIISLAFLLSIFSFTTLSANQNQVYGFVYHWFSLFDRNAPVAEFLEHIPTNRFKMVFPEATLTSREDFKRWYKGIQTNIKNASHEIVQLNINEEKGQYLIELVVLWRATTFKGESLSFDALQTWKIELRDGRPFIHEYFVTDGKGYRNKTLLKVKSMQKPAFGGFVTISGHKVIENLAVAKKLDFVWIEAEHTEIGPKEVQEMVLAAENEGLTPIVRVPANDFNLIKKYMGTGIQGVVVPSIRTADDAKNAVKAIKYAPAGERPAGVERANRYLANFADYKQRANSEMLVILMIETREAVDNIEEILKVPGIDILHMGPYDLALSYGVEMQSETLAMALKSVEMAAARHKMPLGSSAPSLKLALEKIDKGYLFFTIPGDMEFLQNGVKKYFKN